MEATTSKTKSVSSGEYETAAEEIQTVKPVKKRRGGKLIRTVALVESPPGTSSMAPPPFALVNRPMPIVEILNLDEITAALDDISPAPDTSGQNDQERTVSSSSSSSNNWSSSSDSSSDSDSVDLSDYDMCEVALDLRDIPVETSLTTTIESQVRSVYNYVKKSLTINPKAPKFQNRPAYNIPMNGSSSAAAKSDPGKEMKFQEMHFDVGYDEDSD